MFSQFGCCPFVCMTEFELSNLDWENPDHKKPKSSNFWDRQNLVTW